MVPHNQVGPKEKRVVGLEVEVVMMFEMLVLEEWGQLRGIGGKEGNKGWGI